MKKLRHWKHKRIAIVDLGTNSVRFDIHEVRADGAPLLIHREKLMVRLGENVFIHGKLDPNAVRRSMIAFANFQRIAAELHVDRVAAFGTAALREAQDSERFVRNVRNRFGFDIKIISGKEEAQLIASAILKHEAGLTGRFALVDIGGGSTEISICNEGKILHCESFPLGVARLQQIFLRDNPPLDGADSVRQLRRHIEGSLKSVIKEERWPKVPRLIGSSGTVRTLVRMQKKIHGRNGITQEELAKLVKQMTPLTQEELRAMPGMEPKRVDLILAGAVVLLECMQAVGARKVYATEVSLRDGILDHHELFLDPDEPHPLPDLSILYERLGRFGISRVRLEWNAELASRLFERFQSLHKLSEHWAAYLVLAALFRNSGKAVSPINAEAHSRYIALNCDLPLLEAWEREFIAELCALATRGKVEKDFLEGKREHRKNFLKLLALLRLLDAFDASFPSKPNLKQIRITDEAVRFVLMPGDSTELVVLKLQQRKALFEDVFDCSLQAVVT